jgi:2-keto-3-deoxy-L-arabinonate dehydratase
MNTPAWRGIFPSLCTPFDADGAIDLSAMRAVVRFAIESGANGLVCLGLAGEVGLLTPEERMRLVDAIVAESNGGCPILVGATADTLANSLVLARHAESVGASGVVLAPPTTDGFSGEDLVSSFVKIAGVVSLPIVVQDAPDYLGVEVDPRAVVQAAEQAPNIIGVKLETGPEGIDRWRTVLGSGFLIFGGNGGLYLVDCLRAGADGLMPGVDTVDVLVGAYRAEAAGDGEEAERLFWRLLPMLVFEMQSIHHFNACAKHVLARRGLAVQTILRPPGVSLGRRSSERLDRYMEAVGIGRRLSSETGASREG